ncbi:cupin-like domain-containing protein [Pseudoalteromonas sp. T1lg23B]|uniref:cupin-like domain-containing protein n=1 Tax=Pseudoalteromonas sp. T1lg23B TaxID=2077097 RepID=UPI000CF614C1|nr:cupin-like domain-containing protein [Pseudoalteromonas sp. T1lg23B]
MEHIKQHHGLAPQDMVELVQAQTQLDNPQPLVFKGVVSHWPVVAAALDSDAELCNYLTRFDVNASVYAYSCEAKYQGRFFYDETHTKKNFSQIKTQLSEILLQLQNQQLDNQPSIYMGSTTLGYCLPNFAQENSLPMLDYSPLISLWLGNQSEVAAHYDIPQNIACVVAGTRQFTLFKPDQIDALYPGPIDFTPAGQIVSMVDFNAPDSQKFPKFKSALEQSLYAELGPGDAIYIPSMWWHHVKSTSSINALINYWWRETDAYLGLPTDVLNHAVMSIGHLPAAQKQAWKAIFDHYVFSDNAHEHINSDALGSLGEVDEVQARKIRWQLLQQLNR